MEQKQLHEEKIVANATIAEEEARKADSEAKVKGPRKEMNVLAAHNVLAASDVERPLGSTTLTKEGKDDEVEGSEVPGSSIRVLRAEKRKFPSGASRNEATKVSNPPHSFVEIDLTTETDDEDESEGPSRPVVKGRQTGFGNDEVDEDTIVKEQRAASGCRCKYVVKHIQGKCTTPKPPVVPAYKRPRRRL